MFWSVMRMIERWWLICGLDMLGMPPMEQNVGPCRRNPFIKAAPVTPFMDTQLDEMTIRDVLVPLKNKLMRLLRERMLARKREDWYEIYLVSFIILHNSERVLSHIMNFARRFGVNVSVYWSSLKPPRCLPGR
jgi:transposase InsO family protein